MKPWRSNSTLVDSPLTSSPHPLLNPKSPDDPFLASLATPHSRAGRTHRALSVLFSAVAALLLVTWIVAAAYLAQKKAFLPLDFFEGRFLSNDNFNLLISVTGTFVGIFSGIAIGEGFKALVRRRLLSPRGLSLYAYDALAKASEQTFQLKLAWSAIFALWIFSCIELSQPAIVDAFGTAVGKTNLSLEFNSTHLSDYVAALDTAYTVAGVVAPTLVDFDRSIGAAQEAVLDRADQFTAFQGLHQEDTSRALPIFDALSYTSQIPGYGDASSFSASEQRMVFASGNTTIHVPRVEAFFANASCSNFTPRFRWDANTTRGWTNGPLTFPCGRKFAVYDHDSASDFVADTYACTTDAQPQLYLFGLNVTAGAPLFAYECNVSTSSADVPIDIYVQQFRAGVTSLDPASITALSTFPIVRYLGLEFLNAFGSRGWPALTAAFAAILNNANDTATLQRYAETAVETIAKVELAGLSAFVFGQVQSGSALFEPGEGRGTVTAQYRVQALKQHVSGLSLGWFLVPLSLLALLLYSSSLLLLRSPAALHPADLDLTDPTTVALVGLGMPLDHPHGDGKGPRARKSGVRIAVGPRKGGTGVEMRAWREGEAGPALERGEKSGAA
ncbi:hypothetical protein JCM10207_008862 [Rhodosporidiobolus poonsookiae]